MAPKSSPSQQHPTKGSVAERKSGGKSPSAPAAPPATGPMPPGGVTPPKGTMAPKSKPASKPAYRQMQPSPTPADQAPWLGAGYPAE